MFIYCDLLDKSLFLQYIVAQSTVRESTINGYGLNWTLNWMGVQSTIHYTAQWCVLTISIPLGVGQAPVENSWGTYKIKNIAQKKLALKGTLRLIPYIHKIWSLSTMNLPVQDLIRQKWFFGKCKNWSFQFQK